MVSSWPRHGLLDHRPWKVLLSVSMPNQLMPVSRTVAPVLSRILLPLVCRKPVPVPPVAADAAGRAATRPATRAPAAAVANATRRNMGCSYGGGNGEWSRRGAGAVACLATAGDR